MNARDAAIQLPHRHDVIHIKIFATQYDMYHATF